MPVEAKHKPSLESVTSINRDGSHYMIHPADVRGRFTLARRASALLLIAVYVLLPWITINGYPAVFLDLIHRRFHFFGLTLATQDLWLAFFLVSGTGFLLFYVTALFGRLWCGWACPQTVFLEHVFRRIERWIDGDAIKRRKLDRGVWTTSKVIRRVVKYAIFFILSTLIAHIFLSYFISLPELYRWMQSSPAEHWHAFLFVFVFSVVLFVNFSWFREQLCIIICPYGRLQSALIDDDSTVIGYDEKRGEPRGKANEPEVGHCIDCDRCVQVCPTGIDIRQGLQMECIGCANCIDACDAIMDRLKRPRGLVRYDSLNGLAGLKKRIIRPRIILYTALMLLGAAVMTYSFSNLKPANFYALRMQGSPFYVTADVVRNQYNIRIINKTTEPMRFEIEPVATEENLQRSGFEKPLEVSPMGEVVTPLVLLVPIEKYSGPFTVTLRCVTEPGGFTLSRQIEFLGPDIELLKSRLNEKSPGP